MWFYYVSEIQYITLIPLQYWNTTDNNNDNNLTENMSAKQGIHK